MQNGPTSHHSVVFARRAERSSFRQGLSVPPGWLVPPNPTLTTERGRLCRVCLVGVFSFRNTKMHVKNRLVIDPSLVGGDDWNVPSSDQVR